MEAERKKRFKKVVQSHIPEELKGGYVHYFLCEDSRKNVNVILSHTAFSSYGPTSLLSHHIMFLLVLFPFFRGKNEEDVMKLVDQLLFYEEVGDGSEVVLK